MATGRGMIGEGSDVSVIAASSPLPAEELLDAVKSEKDVQLFDADSVAGVDHIRLAFFHAEKAFEEGRNLVRDRMLEVLLRAAASRQVPDAVKRVGVKDPSRIVIAFKGERNKASLLRKLKAKETKLDFAKSRKSVAARFHLDPKRDIERQIIEKMVLLQLE